MKHFVLKLVMRLAFWALYNEVEREAFRLAVARVRKDVRIPIYTRDEYRHGHEARHDVAAEIAERCLPATRDSLLNLGVEMAYWLVKH